MERYITAFLTLVGLAAIGFGIAYFVAPGPLLDATGYADLAPEALTDVRATYGGLQLGFGIFSIWTARDAQRHRPGLVAAAIVFACIAATRIIGMIVDAEPTPILMFAAVIETAWAAVAYVLLTKSRG